MPFMTASQASLNVVDTNVDTIITDVGAVHTLVDTAIADIATVHGLVDTAIADIAGVSISTAGLSAIETKVDTAIVDIGTVHTLVDTAIADIAAISISTAGLSAIETKVDTAIVDIGTVHTLVDTAIADIADSSAILSTVDTNVDTIITNLATADALIDGISLNRTKVFQKALDVDCDVGAQTVATMTSSCQIESIVLKMVTYTANMTSIVITGGASNVVDFIDVIEGGKANLNAADKQVAWSGVVELGDGKTIVATFDGTTGVNVSVLITITYRPCTITGTMA